MWQIPIALGDLWFGPGAVVFEERPASLFYEDGFLDTPSLLDGRLRRKKSQPK